MQHYCSALDMPELPAGLVMLDSLRALERPVRWHVLCLSEVAALVLASLNHPDLSIIRLADLAARFPAVAGDEAHRGLLTPFLAAFCLDSDPSIARITAIGPATYFHHDPQPVFDQLGAAATGVARAAGRLDGGWISYPATDAGRRCLAEHQAAVAAGGDPSLEQCAIVTHPGANADDVGACGDQKLLWRQFAPLRSTESLTFDIERPTGREPSRAQQRLDRNYFVKLVQAARALRARFPNLPLATERPVESVAAAAPEWALQPEGWQPEQSDAGWNDELVNQLRLHRLLDLTARIASTAPLDSMAWRYCITLEFVHAVARAARGQGPVSVLDWGGGLGEHYLSLRALWPDLAVDYHIRDVAAVCDYGSATLPEVRFHESDDTAFARRYDVVFGSSVLQYAPAWPAALALLAQATGRYLLLTRLPMVATQPTFVVRQCPQLYGGTTSYQSWVFNQQSLLETVAGTGLALVRELLVEERTIIPGAVEQPTSRGLLLERIG